MKTRKPSLNSKFPETWTLLNVLNFSVGRFIYTAPKVDRQYNQTFIVSTLHSDVDLQSDIIRSWTILLATVWSTHPID